MVIVSTENLKVAMRINDEGMASVSSYYFFIVDYKFMAVILPMMKVIFCNVL